MSYQIFNLNIGGNPPYPAPKQTPVGAETAVLMPWTEGIVSVSGLRARKGGAS
jgi:hypothetical protein